MHEPRKTLLRRRDLLLAVPLAGIAGVAGVTSVGSAELGVAKRLDKRKAQYQADSAEIQTYYRVNRYPVK
jgi:nitrous oxide reductase